jgi:hypothetical protein
MNLLPIKGDETAAAAAAMAAPLFVPIFFYIYIKSAGIKFVPAFVHRLCKWHVDLHSKVAH